MWWIATLAWALPAIDPPVATEARHPADAAVVIGIEDYFLLPDVPHATADAGAFEGFLRTTRGLPGDRIRVLGRGANREQILDAVGTLGQQVGAGGTLWVYYAGHGAADPESGERILLGADAQADTVSFRARAVALSELETLATAGGGHGLFVLDTCYSGRARGGADLVEGKRFAVPDYAGAPAPGVTRWTAAGPSEWSSSLPGTDHGAFTWAVLGALRGWADADADGRVTAAEADAYVTTALREVGVTDQRPALVGSPTTVLSTATEPAPALAPELRESAVLGALVGGSQVFGSGGLGLRTAPRVARVTAGPEVDLARRGPYTQAYRPRVGGLIWGLGLTAVGGAVALQTSSNYAAGEVETQGDWTRMLMFNVTGGSTALLGAAITALSLRPDRHAPIHPVEAE